MVKSVRFLVCMVALFGTAGLLSAQVPQSFAYQAVVRNEANKLIRNASVSVQISILKDSEEGEAVYTEKKSVLTNDNGLFSFIVGESTPITGVDWGNGKFYLKSEVDIDNDGTFDRTSTQQLISVPYSLYAEHSSNGLKAILSRDNSGDCDNLTQIKNIAPPTEKNDAVTKGYLDDLVQEFINKNMGCKTAAVSIASLDATEKDCGQRLTVKLASSSGTVTYKWYKDGVAISGETEPKLDATVSGKYTVEVTATCDKATPQTATAKKDADVTAKGPALAVNISQTGGTMSGSTITLEKGKSLTLKANPTTSATTSFQWSGGSSSTEQSISVSPTSDATYTVTVTATDENYCVTTESATVNVKVETPCPTPTISSYNAGCGYGAEYVCFNNKASGGTVTAGASNTITVKAPTSYNCSGCEYKYEIWAATTATGTFNNSVALPSGKQESAWSSSQTTYTITFSPTVAGSSYYYIVKYSIRNSCGNVATGQKSGYKSITK